MAITNPAQRNDVVGHVCEATRQDAKDAIGKAVVAQLQWDARGVVARAGMLDNAAAIFEARRDDLVSLLLREAGKTINDALAEIRETVDFCRYYAEQARNTLTMTTLPGPVGEENVYSLHGRGVFVCISPWNFPLAIFVGQIAAALVAGNSVIAKPAEQTPLIAALAVKVLVDAGVPADVLSFLPGQGEIVGEALVTDERIAGVVMTGSTSTAKRIAKNLADRNGPIIPFIAETGGQNAMFVDSSALPEQVVDDVVRSAFHSAGQRCSALRVLYVQDEIADTSIEFIKGAMNELRVGDPALLETDVGPVIDEASRSSLLAHIESLKARGCLLHACGHLQSTCNGSFVLPHLFQINSVTDLASEQFGPILHVVRYRADELEKHLASLRATQFGLTLGIHSRLASKAKDIFAATLAGNVYVNRNMIGATVGVQPFGGRGLSGTGPKAGGPLYLSRFVTERVLTTNTAATGGNTALLSLDDEPGM